MSRRHPKKSTRAARHANLPRDLLKHPAVATLSGASLRVCVALAAEYHGGNNGALAMTRDLGREYGIASASLHRALSGGKHRGELMVRGLVELTDPGSYVPPRAARYAITWRARDNTEWSTAEPIARHSYRDWRPAKTETGARCEASPGIKAKLREWSDARRNPRKLDARCINVKHRAMDQGEALLRSTTGTGGAAAVALVEDELEEPPT